MKVLNCRDAGFDCNKVIMADNENEVMRQAAEHAREVHGMEVTPEMAQEIKSLIREENQRAASV
jgi:predicted small metal-binding protein